MRYQLFILSILLFLIGEFHRGVVSAETNATITICNSGCTTNTWLTGFNLANSGDTISILSDLEITNGAIINSKTLTIQGNNYTVSKSSGSTGAFLGFEFATVTINNLTFSGGNNAVHGTNGGALWVTEDSTLTLNNVEFRSNQAGAGGALYVVNSVANVDNSLFQSNSSNDEGGGAIYSISSTVSVKNTQFLSNSAARTVCCGGDGGAILSVASGLTVENSVFRLNTTVNNSSDDRPGGGAISWQYLRYNPFVSNETAALNIFDSTFILNQAEGAGGGVYFWGSETNGLNIRKNLFHFNFASRGGGISIIRGSGAQIIANNTFVDNRVTELGGGILWTAADGRLESNTIYRNHAPEAANVFFGEAFSGSPVNYKVRNNIIALPQGGGDNCSNEDLEVIYKPSTGEVYPNLDDDGSCDGFTIEADPLLVGPADNGGPTFTMRPVFGSPVFDEANWDGTVGSIDQRGVSRGGNGVSDLGAYEKVTQGDCHTLNQTIPGGSSSGLTDVISAPSFLAGEIVDVDVTLKVDTVYLGDISASVRSPGNVLRTLLDRPGYPASPDGCFAPSMDAVFDSDGFLPTVDATCPGLGSGSPINGRFKPINTFTTWNGSQTEGNWILNVTDATGAFGSSLVEWCVNIEYFPDSAATTPTAVNLSRSEATGAESWAFVIATLLITLTLPALLNHNFRQFRYLVKN